MRLALPALLLASLAACAAPTPSPAYSPVTDEEAAQHAAIVAEAASPAPTPTVRPEVIAAQEKMAVAVAEERAKYEAHRERMRALQGPEPDCSVEDAMAEAGSGQAAEAQADANKASHVAWVHDHCSARQPPPVVTCNPVCVARRACFVWTCEAHPDWAEEVSIYDCDPHRNAHAISVHSGVCAARRHQGTGPRGGSFRD